MKVSYTLIIRHTRAHFVLYNCLWWLKVVSIARSVTCHGDKQLKVLQYMPHNYYYTDDFLIVSATDSPSLNFL